MKKLLCKRRPYKDENLPGFLIRLTELNAWESIGWLMDYANIGINGVSKKSIPETINYTLNDGIDLNMLGHVTCNEPNLLYSKMYLPASGHKNKVLYMGQPLTKHAIDTAKPRVCPACLQQSKYIRMIWDLAVVTCCPEHNCLLIDTCPSCGKKLSWRRNKVSICPTRGCNYDFRHTPITKIPKKETFIAAHVASLLKQQKATDSLKIKNPIAGLQLDEFIKLVPLLLSIYHGGNFVANNNFLFKRLKLIDRHHAIQPAHHIFTNWPKNYKKLFDDYTRYKHCGGNPQFPIQENSLLPKGLFNKFKAEFAFANAAYQHYIRTTSYDRTPSDQQQIVWDSNNQLIFSYAKPNTSLIDRRSLKLLRQKHYYSHNIKEVAQYFNMPQAFVKMLVKAGELQYREIMFAGTLYKKMILKKDMEMYFHKILNNYMNHGFDHTCLRLLCFKEAFNSFEKNQLFQKQFVYMVSSGQIQPCGIDKKKGLNQFLFDQEQTNRLIADTHKFEHDDCPVAEAA